jgi:S-disulfanyl-L-cysteine oxidoreductase SoxD
MRHRLRRCRGGRRHWVARVIIAGGLGAAGLTITSAAAPAAAAQPAAAATRYAWDGVFTDVQADRGEREYGRTCSHCHGLSLEGDGAREVPTLVSDPFQRRWRGRTVQALFDTLMRSMPADDLGTLTPRAAADLIAYLLRANGAPAGQTPLPSEGEAIASVVIDERPSGP